MYSFGMSTRDIQRHLQQVYGVEVSPPIRRFVPVDIMFFYPGKSSLIFGQKFTDLFLTSCFDGIYPELVAAG